MIETLVLLTPMLKNYNTAKTECNKICFSFPFSLEQWPDV